MSLETHSSISGPNFRRRMNLISLYKYQYEADISQVQNEKIIFSTGVNKNIIMLEMIKNEKEDSVKLLTDSY